MSKVVVQAVAVSLDGFAAGTDQSLDNPLGVRGPELFEWFFPTKTFIEQHGGEGGETGIDDDFAARSMSGKGAWILGRNMFGPVQDINNPLGVNVPEIMQWFFPTKTFIEQHGGEGGETGID